MGHRAVKSLNQGQSPKLLRCGRMTAAGLSGFHFPSPRKEQSRRGGPSAGTGDGRRPWANRPHLCHADAPRTNLLCGLARRKEARSLGETMVSGCRDLVTSVRRAGRTRPRWRDLGEDHGAPAKAVPGDSRGGEEADPRERTAARAVGGGEAPGKSAAGRRFRRTREKPAPPRTAPRALRPGCSCGPRPAGTLGPGGCALAPSVPVLRPRLEPHRLGRSLGRGGVVPSGKEKLCVS